MEIWMIVVTVLCGVWLIGGVFKIIRDRKHVNKIEAIFAEVEKNMDIERKKNKNDGWKK